MRKYLAIIGILFAAAAIARAQVAPAATGAGIHGIEGLQNGLKYGLRFAEVDDHYSNGGLSGQKAMASGSLQYANENERLPFDMQFEGGYGWIESGVDYGAGFFENFLASQGIKGRHWGLTLDDSSNYFPQSPVAAGGPAGTGAPITGSGSGAAPTQSILTVNAVILDNSSDAKFERSLGASNTLNLQALYQFITFPNGGGFGEDTRSGSAGLSQRLDARNTLTETYAYEQYAYSDSSVKVTTNSGTFGYQRAWSRKLITAVSAGPDWVANTQSGQSSGWGTPQLAVNGSASYVMHSGTAAVSYFQGTNSGGGYIYGGGIKMATASYTAKFRNRSSLGVQGGWDHTVSLASPNVPAGGAINSKFGSVQFAKTLGGKFSIFVNYMASAQTSSLPVTNSSSLLNMFWQRASAGIAYGSAPNHF